MYRITSFLLVAGSVLSISLPPVFAEEEAQLSENKQKILVGTWEGVIRGGSWRGDIVIEINATERGLNAKGGLAYKSERKSVKPEIKEGTLYMIMHEEPRKWALTKEKGNLVLRTKYNALVNGQSFNYRVKLIRNTAPSKEEELLLTSG